MRIVIDYRPALRARSGVGEYIHQLARYLRAEFAGDRLTLFTSSWKDRPDAGLRTVLPGARVSDHRVPVRLLNFAWHRLEWPPVEMLTGERYDVTFSPHPLLLPSRDAAPVVLVADVDFIKYPERAHREIRRDYAPLAAAHAQRAARVITISEYSAAEIARCLDVPREKIVVCHPGSPHWQDARRGFDRDGYLLFVGTLGARKNIGGLLTAYERLVARVARAPKLVLMGNAGPEGDEYIRRINKPPLEGRVEHRGYVVDSERQNTYLGARALVLPSFDEGFGMPALEAMSLGIPVIASARGALPEVIDNAGVLIDPDDDLSLVDALARVATDDTLAETLSARGLGRSREFSWQRTARLTRQAFADAIAERMGRAPVTRTRR